jgi:protein-disulfide isomerase-like protein with CxxC motif
MAAPAKSTAYARWLIVSQAAGRASNAVHMLASAPILFYHETSISIVMKMAMTAGIREKFSSQAAPEVLAALRQIAESQGRQFQAVLDEALRDYIDRQQKERPRRHVMTAFASSLDEFDSLYRELAK